MYLLKEKVGTIRYPLERAAAFSALLSRLADLRLPVDKADELKGEIVVRCFTQVLNAGIWRCWADRLVFEVSQDDPSASNISIFALPNLMRIRKVPGELVFDLQKIKSELIFSRF